MITLHKGQYLSDVMSEIPSNCILSKRIPGCGATTLELETQRNSIIVVPNVPVIKSKCGKYSNLLGVYEDVTTDKIRNYLTNNRLHKIMTTPESFGKVKNACSGIDIYNHFFLLMDECHQLIKDVDYRTDIVLPMNDFFRFKSKALVSATPIGFSDPRFKEFETVEVSADYDYRQEIAVTHTYNIYKAISEYLGNHTEETVCFFVNSVVMIYSIMKQFGILEDSTVYCAPKSRLKLKNEYSFDNAYNDWNADTMKKYNFFTGRFAFGAVLETMPFRKFLYSDFTKNWFAIDNEINSVLVNNRYQSRQEIKNWYNDCHFFNPTFENCEYNENDEKLKIAKTTRSVKDKHRKMVQLLSEMETPYSEYALDFINDMRKIDPFIVEAFETLGKERIEELNYSKKKIKEEMILTQRKGNKVIRLVKNIFKVGNRYSNEKIVNELTRIYERLNIHPEENIEPKLIGLYYQANPFKSGNIRGYQLNSELV